MNPDDQRVVNALLEHNEEAYVQLVRRLHARLIALARRIVRDEQTAEDVVQETWSRVLKALPGFAGRSRLDTWIFQIAINRARTRLAKEKREVPLSSLADDERDPLEGHFNRFGQWRDSPAVWPDFNAPESILMDRQLTEFVATALDSLPERQRLVVTMRDVEGIDSATTCSVLGLSEENQRVLLHRGRTQIRQTVERTLMSESRRREHSSQAAPPAKRRPQA